MASSLGNPFSVYNTTCPNNLSITVNSNLTNPTNLALVAVEGVCFVFLFVLLWLAWFWTRGFKLDSSKSKTYKMVMVISGMIVGMLASLALAIPIIVLKSSFGCLIKRYYIYLYAVLGITWRSTEIITAVVISKVAIHQLRATDIDVRRISQSFNVWLFVVFALNLSSYILYLLWIIPLLESETPSYSTAGFGNDFSIITFAYQVSYLVLSVGFVAVATYLLARKSMSKHDRNLMVLVVISLLIREIDQVLITAKSSIEQVSLSIAYVLADTIIYDITTACLLFCLVLIGLRYTSELELGTAAEQPFNTIWREATGKSGGTVSKSSEVQEYPFQDAQYANSHEQNSYGSAVLHPSVSDTAAQCPISQYPATQYSTAQYSTTPYSAQFADAH